jgi:uncharacterized SAM-binding protein YcdF (DUF218 family)
MIFSPGAGLAALCGLGAALLWIRPRAGRILVCLGAAGFLAIAALPIDQWLLLPLENRFPQPPADAKLAGIIVLGGSIDAAMTADRGLPSLNAAADRLTALAALALSRPDLPVVFTGGPPPNRPGAPPEAAGVRILMRQLGVPDGRIQYESASRTTYENAVLSTRMVHPKPGQTWLLVTSAAHMPRAVGTFRAAGWTVLADPVGYKSFRDPAARALRGFGERLWLIDTTAHEWFGLVQYWVMGRSSAVFPEP